MFGRKKRIRIEFYDATTGEMIGFDEKKPKKIPPTFEYETLVKIGGRTWKLATAEPFARKDFLRAGTLKITLQPTDDNDPLTQVDHSAVRADSPRYVRPSRAATIPHFLPQTANDLLTMAAWEWREIELIAGRYRGEIARELEAIQALRDRATVEEGGKQFFRDQHVRSLPESGLLGLESPLEALIPEYFPSATPIDGIGFMGEPGQAADAYAFRMPAGLRLYGLRNRRQLQCLGIVPPTEESHRTVEPDLRQLVHLMERQDLVLVDWSKGRFVEPILPALAAYFGIQLADPTSATATEPTPVPESPTAPPEIEVPTEPIPDPPTDELFAISPTPPPVAPEAESEPEQLADMTIQIDLSLDPEFGNFREEE
ncbi:MAG: hypothetical protein AAGN35_27125 [Bacteroidota bacterium]